MAKKFPNERKMDPLGCELSGKSRNDIRPMDAGCSIFLNPNFLTPKKNGQKPQLHFLIEADPRDAFGVGMRQHGRMHQAFVVDELVQLAGLDGDDGDTFGDFPQFGSW